MDEQRKRNLVNVSQHIMSPSQSKALSEQKGFARPPSHPGPAKGLNGGHGGGLPLPPKNDSSTVKRTSSYVVKPSQSSNGRITNAYGSGVDAQMNGM